MLYHVHPVDNVAYAVAELAWVVANSVITSSAADLFAKLTPTVANTMTAMGFARTRIYLEPGQMDAPSAHSTESNPSTMMYVLKPDT